MEYINRRVFLTKDLVPYDSDNDGVNDKLILSATTKSLLIPLKQSFDDIGVYNVYDYQPFEVIDISSVFDSTISPNQINQPDTTPPPQVSVWDGGGTSGINQDVYYCNDSTAINYESLTYDITNVGGTMVQTAILTDNEGNSRYFQANSLGDIPNMVVDNNLCTYISADTTLDDIVYTESNNISDMICITSSYGHGDPDNIITTTDPKTGNCNESWFNTSPWYVTSDWTTYKTTAYNKAVSYCQSLGYNTTLQNSDFTGTIPQGDPITDPTQPWAEVKYQTVTQGTCNTNPSGNGVELTGTQWKFCFFCKK